MHEPERITSPYAPDLNEVRAFLEQMIRALRFVELIRAVLAFVTRVSEVNGELSKKLADLRRRRPRSESLERLERQLVLPLADLGITPARRTETTERASVRLSTSFVTKIVPTMTTRSGSPKTVAADGCRSSSYAFPSVLRRSI
jgi:hypothetical protein